MFENPTLGRKVLASIPLVVSWGTGQGHLERLWPLLEHGGSSWALGMALSDLCLRLSSWSFPEVMSRHTSMDSGGPLAPKLHPKLM